MYPIKDLELQKNPSFFCRSYVFLQKIKSNPKGAFRGYFIEETSFNENN